MPGERRLAAPRALLCPSAQPDMADSVVLGVMTESDDGPRLAYLDEPQPVTKELLALAGSIRPTQVFRLAATCEESACAHFDGQRCRLVSRIVRTLPAVVDVLPPCRIRVGCRWFAEEGAAACQRCPQIRTYIAEPSDTEVRAATPA